MYPALPESGDWSFDADLLRRYGVNVPRYTSYPSALQFDAAFGPAQFAEQARQSNVGHYSRQLSLYVHVPFCASPCFYCGCNRVITRSPLAGDRYVRHLEREIAQVAALFEPDREVVQLHFGGGTPNFLDAAQLTRVVDGLRRHFRFSQAADRDISIELDPRTTTPAHLAALGACGFTRASLGVQDFSPGVQHAINRVQSFEQTYAVVAGCRAHGIGSINLDLVYGLPHQTLEGFARTLDQTLELRPDRLAVYGYAHMPALFRAQRQIDEDALPDAEGRLALLELAVRRLRAAGYEYIGLDHFALPSDALSVALRRGSLHRNFMGYTTHAQTDLLGFGVSAISHVGDSYSQNPRELPAWEAALDAGRLPTMRGVLLDEDDAIRADVIQRLMCGGRVEAEQVERAWSIRFDDYFRDEIDALAPLVRDGLVQVAPEAIQVTARGRGLLRLVAMRFDRYLAQGGLEGRHSRAV
ncbi:oxygen-independent coproporphyrinogen III oxidase [Pseudoxanthomonas winnipegensis]|uniref:oxygen-independent coproporphyrinogen III oxidase n=1 Tax=Pseudoxanthomonas winnipegensis TaxID=2480810 RepID=UPI003F866604